MTQHIVLYNLHFLLAKLQFLIREKLNYILVTNSFQYALRFSYTSIALKLGLMNLIIKTCFGYKLIKTSCSLVKKIT